MIGQVIGAGINIASGLIGRSAKQRELAKAQREYDRRKAEYENLDTSNVYRDMENTMEDLTVDQRAAEFQAQQEQQGLSNTLSSLSGSAGGSGIAALAQSLAGAQSQNLQRASANIGQQERANQQAAASQAANLQLYEAKGELISRDAQKDKTETLFGMSQENLSAKKQAVEESNAQIMGGVGGIASAGLGFVKGLPGLSDTVKNMI